MNKLALLTLFSFLALACLPLVAAQEGNALTDLGQSISDGLGNLWNTASTYVSERPWETGTIATTGGAAVGLGAAYKKLKSGYNTLKDKLTGAESDVTKATEQLSSYKSQAEAQLSGLQTETAKQLEAYKTQASNATGQLSGIQNKLDEALQQKASLKNQFDELKATSDKTITGLQAQVALLSKKLDV